MKYKPFASAFVVVVFGFLILPLLAGQNPKSPKGQNLGGDTLRMEVTAFRFREDLHAGLNDDSGWTAPENSAAEFNYDTPFRLRVQVRGGESSLPGVFLGLQYQRENGPWTPVGTSDFPYPKFATPVVSVVTTTAYEHGEETERLLGGALVDWDEGAGLNGIATTPVWNATDEAVEWEWPLVIRRFADGPNFMEDGEIFEIRVVDGKGSPLAARVNPRLSMSAAPGHLGGTFIETPGRIGPYQAESGNLYFFMEPTETDNRFMAVVSSDFGQSWKEADPGGRPMADDLEGVATARIDNTIHIIHQVSREVFHHAFEMDGSGAARWLIDSQSIATHEVPPTQFAALTARSDGSLVALYAGPKKLFLQTRSPGGDWSEPAAIDQDVLPDLSGPVLAAGPNDVVTVAYTGRDGRGFIRHLDPDGSLSPRKVLSNRLGREDRENGAILPMVVLPESGTTVVLFREEDGILHERRFSSGGELSEPIRVTSLPVVANAVDSEQVGADLILHGSTAYLLFIEETSRSIFHSYSKQPGAWSKPELLIDGIDGSWLRGSLHRDKKGRPVYGFVYDAGSKGGSGLNRYFALSLDRRFR